MNLWNYIQGERSGDAAHQLEKEAMRDPFLQDAIDGYDRVNDRPVEHLKKLEKRLSNHKGKTRRMLQRLGIAAAVLLVIGLSVFFFLSGRVNALKNTFFIENHADSIISKYAKDTGSNLSDVKQPFNNGTMFHPDSIDGEKKETLDNPTALLAGQTQQAVSQPTLQTGKKKSREVREEDPYPSEMSSDYTLSDGEVQSILSREADQNDAPVETSSGYTLSDRETEALRQIAATKQEEGAGENVLNQPPLPAKGSKAYNSYIEENRKQLEDDRHGKVVLMFHVNSRGRPVDISVLRSLCPEADKEAVRLLQSGPDWTAGNPTARLEIAF